MIITKLRLQEEHPMEGVRAWPLPICDLNVNSMAGEDGYILKESLGLGPTILVPVVVGFDDNGIPIFEPIPEKRDIVLKIGLNLGLGRSYSTLRDDLYKFISRSLYVKLMNEALVIGQTTGFIRQFETVHFSNQPEIQMTIECENGEFSAPNSINIPVAELNSTHPVINYEEGTAPTGLDLKFTYTPAAPGTGFNIHGHSQFWHSGSNASVSNNFTLTFPFLTGDVVTISTNSRNKRIVVLRGATEIDVTGYINAGAVWPKLYPGVNTFFWSFASSWMTWVSASYTPKYWGV